MVKTPLPLHDDAVEVDVLTFVTQESAGGACFGMGVCSRASALPIAVWFIEAQVGSRSGAPTAFGNYSGSVGARRPARN